jgi:hypothetical protein
MARSSLSEYKHITDEDVLTALGEVCYRARINMKKMETFENCPFFQRDLAPCSGVADNPYDFLSLDDVDFLEKYKKFVEPKKEPQQKWNSMLKLLCFEKMATNLKKYPLQTNNNNYFERIC